MFIICRWMIVLLLLVVCSVGCHWRRPIPGSIPSKGLDPVKRSQPSPKLTLLKNAALRAGMCPPQNVCIPTISCPDVLHLLKKAVREPNLREQTIALVRICCCIFHCCESPAFNLQVRRRVCGEKSKRGICCPATRLGYFVNNLHMEGWNNILFGSFNISIYGNPKLNL